MRGSSPRMMIQLGRELPRRVTERVLSRPLAEVGDRAFFAQWPARDAYIASVQDQPVMRMKLVLFRHHLIELHLDLEWRLPRRKAGAVADAKDVRVDRDGRLAEGDVEHHVRGLAAHPGQRLERLAGARDRAAVLFHQ